MLRGDWAELERLVGAARELGSQRLRAALARAGMEGAVEALAEGFATQTDPYGRSWEPSIRARLEGGQTLSDTGLLRRSFRHRSDHRGFWLWVGGPPTVYAGTHQYGAVIRPRRARYLRVPVLGRGRGPRARPVAWRFVQQVVIPRRQMVPEGSWGERWWDSVRRSAEAVVRAVQEGWSL